MKPMSEEARHLQLDSIRREIEQVDELYRRAPHGSAYRDELWTRRSLLLDRWYQVFRAPRLEKSVPLPLHRTEAGYPHCATCDGGGCLDCTDPS